MEQKKDRKNSPFLDMYIHRICYDFKHEIEGGAGLEPLREISYREKQNTPDYSPKIAQQFYLLRYTYIYAFEYKQMFKALLQRIPHANSIDVTSIGCGNGIDYWALQNTLYELRQTNCQITYHGIDYVDWGSYQVRKLQKRSADVLDFVVQDALEYIRQRDTLTSNVFMFPKSISEFDEETFQQFCEEFAGKHFQQDTVHILISLRVGYMNADLNRSRQLAQAMERHGFQTHDDVEDVLTFRGGNEGALGDVDDRFVYPDEVYQYLHNLESRLACVAVRVHPMLNTKYIRYQILTFEKDNEELPW